MPTPKSNPSRTKNPVHKIAMTMYQNGTRLLIVTPLVLDGRKGQVRVVRGAGGGSSVREYFSMRSRSTVAIVP